MRITEWFKKRRREKQRAKRRQELNDRFLKLQIQGLEYETRLNDEIWKRQHEREYTR